MLKNYLPFYEISGELQWILRHMDLMGNDKLSEYSEDVPRYEELLVAIQKACKEHGLAHTAKLAALAAQRKPKTCSDIHHVLTTLNDSLTTDLEREGIFRIDPDNMAYYEQEDAFGSEVATAFSSCARDIRKAGSCYALEQEDACVHHLMLVLERGLGALAARVGNVPYRGVNWQVVINKIESELAGQQLSPVERKFYRDVNAQFGFLKVAYRNYSEHAYDDKYDMPKALHIYNQVRGFMQELAKGGLTE